MAQPHALLTGPAARGSLPPRSLPLLPLLLLLALALALAVVPPCSAEKEFVNVDESPWNVAAVRLVYDHARKFREAKAIAEEWAKSLPKLPKLPKGDPYLPVQQRIKAFDENAIFVYYHDDEWEQMKHFIINQELTDEVIYQDGEILPKDVNARKAEITGDHSDAVLERKRKIRDKSEKYLKKALKKEAASILRRESTLLYMKGHDEL